MLIYINYIGGSFIYFVIYYTLIDKFQKCSKKLSLLKLNKKFIF